MLKDEVMANSIFPRARRVSQRVENEQTFPPSDPPLRIGQVARKFMFLQANVVRRSRETIFTGSPPPGKKPSAGGRFPRALVNPRPA